MEISKNLTFVILVVAFLAIGAYLFVNTDNSATNTVSVQGISEIKAKPDVTMLYVNIETLNKSAKDSEKANSEISSRVDNTLRELGFDDEDIQTVYYTLNEDYKYSSQGSEFNGYKTIHQIKVSVKEKGMVGTIIDRVVDDGALVSSIQFEIANAQQQALKAQALEMASKDARDKAEAIAKGSEMKLGSLVSISTNDYYYMPFVAYDRGGIASADASEAKRAATQIYTQELTITANVQAVYKIR